MWNYSTKGTDHDRRDMTRLARNSTIFMSLMFFFDLYAVGYFPIPEFAYAKQHYTIFLVVALLLWITFLISMAFLVKKHYKVLPPVLYISLQVVENRPAVSRAVTPPPGIWLNQLAEFFASSKMYGHCLCPAIDDMRHEYYEALAKGRTMKARWIRIAGCWAFWKTWGLATVVNTVKIVAKIMAG